MNRSNVPSPIRTSATPTAAATNGGGYYPPSNDFNTRGDAHQQQPQDLNMTNNNVASHEQQHYYNDNHINNGYDGSNNNNDNNMMPTSSAMRQGRFESGSSSGAIHQQQQEITSPSQVTFQPGAAPPQPTTTTTDNNFNSPHSLGANFMFDDIEDFQHYQQQQHHTFPPQTTNDSFPHSPQSTTNTGALPTEAQLTLLCLDYLRSLRRSYQNPQDLFHGEGLHADYISLAVWSLSRAFVSPEKLAFGEPKVSTIVEEDDDGKRKNKKKKGKEIQLVGGGGLAGVEDECVGNDSFYRLVVKKQQQKGDDSTTAIMNNNNSNGIGNSTNEVFELTDSIKLPSMKDITNEVLLSYNNNNNNNEEECPIYEQNDMHLSNSHRFYLFNGMASGDDSMGMMGGGGAKNTPNNAAAPTSSPKAAGPSIIDGGPLTLTDLTTVALSTLNAKSRIEAEREVVQDPLFESFIHAAGEKGFFTEKKLSGKDALSPEEEERRQRLLYENKYRKVVAKFRSKLAVREEQLMLHNGVGGMNVGGGGGWSPRSGQRAMRNVHSVSDQLEMRRDRIIDQVREYRIEEGEEEEDSPIVPYSSSEEEQQSVGNFVANYGLEQQTAGDVVASYEQVVPKRTESEERIEANAMVVERAPVNHPSSVAASPSPVASPPSPAKKTVMVVERPVNHPSSVAAPPSRIQANAMVVERTTEVERAPVNPPSAVAAPPSPVASPPSPAKKTAIMSYPPPSPDKAPKVPPSPAAKLPFYQEAESINAQGNELMQKKQFSQALELYTKALKISPAGPNSHVYYSNRSAAHLSLGDAESSIQDSQLALTIRPDYTKAHSRLGLAHYASGRYAEAVESYEAAMDLEPDNEWVKRQYEKARKMLVKVQEEAEDEKKVLAEDKEGGDWPSPFAKTTIDGEAKRKEAEDIIRQADEYKDSGNAFMKNKQFEEALDQYNLAIETSADGPNSHIYYFNRAAAYRYLKQYSEAADDCLSSLELNDSYEKARTLLVKITDDEKKRLAEDKEAKRKEAEDIIRQADEYKDCGNAFMKNKQFEEALDQYNLAIETSADGPNSHIYYFNRAAAYRYLGQYSEAADDCLSSLDLNDSYDKARTLLVKIRDDEKKVLAEDKEAKRREAEDIIRQADEYKDSGNAFMKDKNFEEALYEYNLAIEISADGPNSHIYYSNRAAAYCYLGQYSEAADDCLSSIELNDSYEKAYSRYGLSLYFLGDYEGSIDAYRKSLELAPDNKASLSYLAKAKARLAVQQENEMQDDMANKLNLGQEGLGAGNGEEFVQDENGEGCGRESNELSQSRDDEGEGVEASYYGFSPPAQGLKGFDPPAFDPFDSDEGDEI